MLEGRTCLVTGASSGIGAGVARLLALQGARVAGIARRAEKLQELGGEIRAGGGTELFPMTADLTRADDINRAVHEAVGELGRSISWSTVPAPPGQHRRMRATKSGMRLSC